MENIKIKETKHFLNMHKRLENAILDYDMIKPGDHVIAGLSGGKDSSILLRLLARKKIVTTNDFTLSSVFVKMGYDGDDEKVEYLKGYSENLGVKFHVVDEPIQETFKREKKNVCYLCSRNRRLAIFRHADSVGANVVAFGHHKDDFMQTLMLNIFYSGTLGAMKSHNSFFDGKYRIIRPMLYIDEQMIISEAEKTGLRTFHSGCPLQCPSERLFVKEILETVRRHYPKSRMNVFRAMYSPNHEYLLKPPSKKGMG
ncbi:MAG TPA: ATP-binding protein [bacterium]|nr:ATP-binding protein [bacterium]